MGKSFTRFSNVKWKEYHMQASVSTICVHIFHTYMEYTAVIFSVGIIVPRFPYGQSLE